MQLDIYIYIYIAWLILGIHVYKSTRWRNGSSIYSRTQHGHEPRTKSL